MSTNTRIKGGAVAAFAVGKTVEIWYAAPNGDSSDSVIHHLVCHNDSQAEAVAEMHRSVWNLTV